MTSKLKIMEFPFMEGLIKQIEREELASFSKFRERWAEEDRIEKALEQIPMNQWEDDGGAIEGRNQCSCLRD